MTDREIVCLRNNVDKLVEIITKYEERLVGKIFMVSDENQDVIYDLISTNKPGFQPGDSYVLRFEDIVSVKPIESCTGM